MPVTHDRGSHWADKGRDVSAIGTLVCAISGPERANPLLSRYVGWTWDVDTEPNADEGMHPRDSPSELAQSRVADAEVMTHLVNDRTPYLLDDISLAGAHRTDGAAEDRDPIGQGASVG